MSGLLLGVDVGTSSTKGVLVRPDGEVVATAERPHDLSLPRPGWAEHAAEKIWWSDFVSICRELLEGADDDMSLTPTRNPDRRRAFRRCRVGEVRGHQNQGPRPSRMPVRLWGVRGGLPEPWPRKTQEVRPREHNVDLRG